MIDLRVGHHMLQREPSLAMVSVFGFMPPPFFFVLPCGYFLSLSLSLSRYWVTGPLYRYVRSFTYAIPPHTPSYTCYQLQTVICFLECQCYTIYRSFYSNVNTSEKKEKKNLCKIKIISSQT
jgi:hypothetical protein